MEPPLTIVRRRNQALAILDDRQDRRIAVVAEAGSPAHVTVAIRNVAVGELEIVAGDPQGYQPVQIGTLLNGEPIRVAQQTPKDDIWRMLGRTAPLGAAAGLLAPDAPLAQSALDFMATSGIYNGLDTLRRQYGLAPWLDMPQFWQ